MGDILSVLDENIGGLRVVKLFNAEKDVHQKFDRESKKYQSLMTSLLRKKDLSSSNIFSDNSFVFYLLV